MRLTATFLSGAAALLLVCAPAGAQTAMIDGSDPEAIASIVRGFGSARVGVAADDTPMVSGRIDGTPFSVYFYQCDDSDANCRSVSFSAGWAVDSVDLDEVNAWNQRSRFGRSYIDEDGEPMLEMDVNLFGSVTEANFEDTVDWWRVVLTDFETKIVEGGESGGESGGQSGGEARPGPTRL